MSRRRTLVLAQNLPYPTFAGMDLRNWQNINGLMGVSQVGVFGLCSNDSRRGRAPQTGLAFWRTPADPALTYPLPKQRLAARGWLLETMGHPSDLFYSVAAAAELAALMADFRPQVVVIEGLWLHRYIDLLKRCDCHIVMDSHNVEAALYREIADATVGEDLPARLIRQILPERTRLIEQTAIQTVDQVWVCSDRDAQLMQLLHDPPTPIRVVPNGVDVNIFQDAGSGRGPRPETVDPTRRSVIFPAMFHTQMNAAAATFLIDEIFPRLARSTSDCQLLLVGSLPTPRMMAAAQREPGIVVTGAVPDVRPYLAAASVMVVPLFQGSGTRFKILEAWAANVPVISTAKGAEGLAVKDGTHLLLAESADEFVDAVQRLWTNQHLADRLTTNGLALVTHRYSWDVISRRVGKLVDELCSNR